MEDPYLVRVVGVPLTQCLGELVEKGPSDPIEWMAHWLYRYIDKELYFYEKSIFLKDLRRMRLELQRANAKRQKVIQNLSAEIYDVKRQTKEDEDLFMNMMNVKLEALSSDKLAKREAESLARKKTSEAGDLRRLEEAKELRRLEEAKELARSLGITPSKLSPSEYAEALEKLIKRQSTSRESRASKASGGSRIRKSTAGSKDSDSRRLAQAKSMFAEGTPGWQAMMQKGFASAKTSSERLQYAGTSTWCLDCNFGLICEHSILGELRARCPFVCPESPEVWESKKFVIQNLYDHEIYSTELSGDVVDDLDVGVDDVSKGSCSEAVDCEE